MGRRVEFVGSTTFMELHLKNIGKIAEATVEIKGITVIGGENNTGKSTVGKSLFSVYNGFCEIQRQIHREKVLGIRNALRFLYGNVHYIKDSGQVKGDKDFSEEILAKAEDYKRKPELLKDEIEIMFRLGSEQPQRFWERINIKDIVSRIIDILKISDKDIFDSILNKRLNIEFSGQLLNIYSESEGIISLKVQNEDLSVMVSENIALANRLDYVLHAEAIYIDDPFVLDDVDFWYIIGERSDTDHHAHLIYKLLQGGHNISVVDELVAETKFGNIYEKISSVCDGDIIQQKNNELGYQLKNSDRILNLKNLSTGLKTFMIIKTLLTNGIIEPDGIVILDEPEIHLHPEWQLLFAEIIVLLNKEFGTNVLLNTHSPYFLRAIQVYSAKYGRNDVCRYYLSENREKGAYIMDVTENVDKIFAKLASPLQKLEDERWNIDLL